MLKVKHGEIFPFEATFSAENEKRVLKTRVIS
jgi:hypothetical protein